MTRACTLLSILFLASLSACNGQPHTHTMNNQHPLLCDPATGICEMPAHAGHQNPVETLPAGARPVKIVYFTDPICSSCWGIEPQLRQLKLEYGPYLDIEYRMGGLLPDWSYNSGGISKPSDVAHHWDEVSLHYDMPIDGDVWLEDPLDSSYPPSIAFKAAQMQDEHKALLFLRIIREMVFLQKKNITRWEHLETAARQAGLDAARLKTDYEGAARDRFRADLDLGKKMGVRGFPTLFFSAGNQHPVLVYGSRPYDVFEKTLLQVYPQAIKTPVDTSWAALFGHYPTLTTREFAELSGTPRAAAEVLLEKLVQEGKLAVWETKNGVLWSSKK